MFRTSIAVATLVTLAACVTSRPDPLATGSGASPGPGWRKGLVVQAGDDDSLGPPIDSDCRERTRSDGNGTPKPDSDGPRRYVEVRYFVGRHAHLRIVPIDDTADVVAGDPVWFRAFGCGRARKVVTSGS